MTTIRRPGGTKTPSEVLVRRPTGRVVPGEPEVHPWWYYTYGHGGAGTTPRPPKAVDITPPDETQASTILNSVVPMVFGTRRVAGKIGAWEYDESGKTLDIGVVFAYGEQDSIATATTYINGEVITSATGVSSEGVHVGDGSTAVSAVLTGMTAWNGAADLALWKSYAHAVMRINCRTSRVPAGMRIESDLGGMLIDASWRSGGSASTASTNPVEIAYHLTTSADYRGVSSSQIHTASWAAVADWCDEVMSDASARYEFNGIVDNRDPAAGVAEVLDLALAYEYIGDDGKIHLWCEMAPPPVTGEWSATASATITEDSTAGEATTELTAGDYVYVGENLRTISSITDDDTVVLDSAVTVSAARVRPISQIYIKKHDWAGPLSAHESSKLSTPDKYRVRFSDGENLGSHEVLSSYGAGTDKIAEGHLSGCTSATVTARHSETRLKVEWTQPWYWQGIVWQDIGAQLEIGDVVLFDDDVLTAQAARVIPPLVARPDGTYVVNLREFDPGAYSDSTDTTDTVPSLGTGWDSSLAPIVSSLISVYSGTEYDAISYDGSGRQVYGDSGAATTVTGSQVRLPNNVPLYALKTGGSTIGAIKCDASDRLVVGDGSEPVYLNSSEKILIPTGGHILADWSGEVTIANHDDSGSPTTVIFGSSSKAKTRVTGSEIRLEGIIDDTGDPTTTDFTSGTWGIYRKTDATTATYLCVNYGGTLYKVELT